MVCSAARQRGDPWQDLGHRRDADCDRQRSTEPSGRVPRATEGEADRLLKFDGTVLLAEDGSQVTAVDGYDPVKGELVFNVGTRMSLNDLAVKTGLSVQRLIDLNAEVFGEEQLDADTILKPGDTVWFESEPESGEEADGSSARGAAGHAPRPTVGGH